MEEGSPVDFYVRLVAISLGRKYMLCNGEKKGSQIFGRKLEEIGSTTLVKGCGVRPRLKADSAGI